MKTITSLKALAQNEPKLSSRPTHERADGGQRIARQAAKTAATKPFRPIRKP